MRNLSHIVHTLLIGENAATTTRRVPCINSSSGEAIWIFSPVSPASTLVQKGSHAIEDADRQS